jgi:hypothetical protein
MLLSRPVRKFGDVSMSLGLRSNAGANSAVDVNSCCAHGIRSAIRPISSKRRRKSTSRVAFGPPSDPKAEGVEDSLSIAEFWPPRSVPPRVWADSCSVLLRGCGRIPSLSVSRHCIFRGGSSRGRISRVLAKTGLAGSRRNTSSNFRARGLSVTSSYGQTGSSR